MNNMRPVLVAAMLLWLAEWEDLKRDALLYWKLVRYGSDYDKH